MLTQAANAAAQFALDRDGLGDAAADVVVPSAAKIRKAIAILQDARAGVGAVINLNQEIADGAVRGPRHRLARAGALKAAVRMLSRADVACASADSVSSASATGC